MSKVTKTQQRIEADQLTSNPNRKAKTMTDREPYYQALEAVCKETLATVGDGQPRYIANSYGSHKFTLIDHADPDQIPADVQVMAVATRQGILGIGGARQWLRADGTVNREYFLQS